MNISTTTNQNALVFAQDLARICHKPSWAYDEILMQRYGGTLAIVIEEFIDIFGTRAFRLLMHDGTLGVFFSDEFVVVQSRTSAYIR